MAFQPFGYQFEVRSPSSPSEAKAAIRGRTKTWFDPKRGARGWIAGPFICLWFSAFDRYGPMLIGRISRDSLGTRIGGRAGANLNGTAMFTVSIVTLACLAVVGYLPGNYQIGEIAGLGVILAIIFFLMLWISDKEKKEADPLVRFLRNALDGSGRAQRAQPAEPPLPAAFPRPLTLSISGSVLDDPATPASVRDALLDVADDGFVILSVAEEVYLQSVGEYDGYIIEKREGDDQHHYRAVRRDDRNSSIFMFEEALAVFLAYGSGAPMPSLLEWEKLRM